MTELHGSRPQPLMIYELGWATLPGLRGLACSDFRAIPTTTPDDFRGVAVEIATEQQRDTLLQQLENHFEAKRFTNSADAFDSVKAFVLDHAAKQSV
jgi:hypothetical protein